MSSNDEKEPGGGPESPRWAADEPTAMWDESSLKDAGYDQLAEHREKTPRAESGPATGRGVGGDREQGVYVSRELTGGHAAQGAPKAVTSGISWALTVGIAIALGVAVYFLITFLR